MQLTRTLMRCLLSLSILLMFTVSAHSSIINAVAILDYVQEVDPSNPTASTATGRASMVFDFNAGIVDLRADITGIFLSDITFPDGPFSFAGIGPFHTHEAPAGENGDVVIPFNDPAFFNETATGLQIIANAALDPTLMQPLLEGNLYLNLHTLDYASGEIRGQISRVPEPSLLGLVGAGLLIIVIARRRFRTGS